MNLITSAIIVILFAGLGLSIGLDKQELQAKNPGCDERLEIPCTSEDI